MPLAPWLCFVMFLQLFSPERPGSSFGRTGHAATAYLEHGGCDCTLRYFPSSLCTSRQPQVASSSNTSSAQPAIKVSANEIQDLSWVYESFIAF